VVTPLATQHYLLLQRNLVCTGITRGKKLVVAHRAAEGAGGRREEPQNGASVFRAAGEAELEVIDMMATQQSWRMPSISNASCDNL